MSKFVVELERKFLIVPIIFLEGSREIDGNKGIVFTRLAFMVILIVEN